MRIFGLVLIVSVLASCAKSNSGKEIKFDMIALSTGIASTQMFKPLLAMWPGDLEQQNSRPTITNYYTPTSFVMKVCTILIGDEDSRLLLLDKTENAECKSLDIAKGESLFKVVELKGLPTFDKIAWMGVFFLPEISITYGSGTTLTYTHALATNGGSSGTCDDDSHYEHYGCMRGRAGYDIDLYESTWGDTRLTIFDGLLATVFIDTENMLEESSSGVTLTSDYYLFPAIGGMKYRRYRIKKASHSGAAATDYPHQVFLLFTREEELVFRRILARNFTGISFASAGRLSNSIEFKNSYTKSEVFSTNTDGSYNFVLSNGNTLTLKKEAHIGTVSGESFFATYEEGLITPLGTVELTKDLTE